ncbi:MAG: glycine--tRNA ligase subunit beta [Candidatus Tectomicrobia bacterium]|nr:glycine--tRNA ligase subunit beta [Candidatus Tectomicrobia bacterium]
MGKELLFEIGTEEIPSAYMPGLLAALKERAEAAFKETRLGFQGLSVMGTPRRLVLHVEDLEEHQRPLSQEIFGPPVSAAFDKEGNPTKAALGFARTCGVEVSALGRKQTEKGERLMFLKEEKGRATKDILHFDILLPVYSSLPSPKTMRWGAWSSRFVRPVHWLLCTYGGEALPGTVSFLAVVASVGGKSALHQRFGTTTRAHRFMGSGKTFQVKNLKEYLKVLRENYVEPDPEKRKSMIRQDLLAEAGMAGGQPAASSESVERLVEKVAFLVEWPFPVACKFEDRFLDLPEEVIISTLEVNQRFFALRKKGGGTLLPNFIGFSNTKARDMGVVRRGYERVVRARLEDAEFYWKQDLKTSLDEMAQRLRGVVYHPRLGTSFQKAERFRMLAGWLRERLFPGPDAHRAFALKVGEACLPRGEGDALPSEDLGALVGLADRMDTLAGLIGLGYLPSGSEDPYALRRGANAILQIIVARGYRLSLPAFAAEALKPLHDKFKEKKEDALARLSDFLRDRLKAVLSREGARGDLVEAVLSASDGKGWHDPVDARARLKALEKLAASTETFEPLTTTFKRVSNIVRQARAEGKLEVVLQPNSTHITLSVSDSLLTESAEKRLWDAVKVWKDAFERSIATYIRTNHKVDLGALGLNLEEAYTDWMEKVTRIRPFVDKFFDDVLVMAEDEGIRRNRLALMAEVAGLFSPVADFAKIQARPTS